MQVRSRSSSRGGPTAAIVAALVAAVLVIAAIIWWPRDTAQRGERPTAAQTPADAGRELRDGDVPALDLPELDASDAFVREFVTGLSEHPQLAAWLMTDDLAFRFVRSTVALSNGQSPREHAEFMAPEGEFQVLERDGGLVVDPAGYARYNLLVQTVESLSTENAARLYRQLYPLFEEAFAELGVPNVTFDDMVAQAVDNLLAVEVPTAPPGVAPSSAVYAYTDERLEERTPAAKHIMRMGPENARRLQAKLGELRGAIWVQP